MDIEIRQIKEEIWRARRNETEANNADRIQEMKQNRRLKMKQRQHKLRAWHKEFWRDFGKEVTEASWKGNQSALFQKVREMLERSRRKIRDGGRVTTENVEEKREAWKMHFEDISKGRWRVAERVWDGVSGGKGNSEWLCKEPSDIEMEKAIGKMKVRKSPGKDGVTAEVLKYGGEQIRRMVFEIVREMWRRASEAEAGKEAEDWPEEWKVRITVPLWKQKGDRKNKNTLRGIT